jgi:tripartite-type tricarboxylate transporter receptor subunit TctC
MDDGRCVFAVLAISLAGAAAAQEYPAKPVRILIAWPPAGIADIVGRVLGERLDKALGQPLIIDNRPGAGGQIGAEAIARAPADGYTFGITTSALNMNAALQPNLPVDPFRHFEPVAIAAYAPSILVVHPSVPARSVKELVALARAARGKLTYASAGNGTPAHFSAELFKSMLDLDIVHVPYKGAPQAMIDQIAGRVDFHFANAPVALPQVVTGRVRGLAVTSAVRFAAAPDLPTMIEAGVRDFEADQWIGYLAPRGTPRAAIDRLATELNRALAQDAIRKSLAEKGLTADGRSTPENFARYLRQDYDKWAAVVKRARIKAD